MNSKVYALSETEVAIRRETLTQLLKQAALVVENNIKNFELESRDQAWIEELYRGLDNLNGRIKLITEGDWLEQTALQYLPEKRGGFGLLRGFSEFLYSWPPKDEARADEIMIAIRKVEYYFHNM